MNIDGLKYFVTVAECGSFSKAADLLYITQPALSRHILRLEEELGAPLLIRSRKDGVTTTALGAACLQDAKQIIRLAARITDKAASGVNEGKETVVIGYNGAEGDLLYTLVHHARRMYPHMNVQLHHENINELLHCVINRTVDIAFLYQGFDYEQAELLDFFPVQESRMEILVSQKHPLAERKCVRMEELREESFVELNRSTFPEFHDAFHALCRKHGFTPKIVCEDESFAVFSGISVGDGIGFILTGTEQSFAAHPIHVLAIDQENEAERWYLSLAWNKENDNPCIPRILTVAKRYLRQNQ